MSCRKKGKGKHMVTAGFHGNRQDFNGKKRCCHFFLAVFIRSFSYLHVIMTYMRAQRSSKFGQIRQLTAELAVLERQKNPHILIMGKMVVPLFISYS